MVAEKWKEGWRLYFQRLLLILATVDVLWMLKGSLSLCSKLIPCIQNTGLLQVSATAHSLPSEEEVSQQYHSAALIFKPGQEMQRL